MSHKTTNGRHYIINNINNFINNLLHCYTQVTRTIKTTTVNESRCHEVDDDVDIMMMNEEEQDEYFDTQDASDGRYYEEDDDDYYEDDEEEEEFDVDFEFNRVELDQEYEADILIPNPILDNVDPEGAGERFGEIAKDPTFWRDLLLVIAVFNFCEYVAQVPYY